MDNRSNKEEQDPTTGDSQSAQGSDRDPEAAEQRAPETSPSPEAEDSASNPKALSDLLNSDLDLQALLAEPLPDEESDTIQKELFVKRQYAGEQLAGKMNALFQRRMGVVLLMIRKEKKHGEWESYVQSTFPFCPKTACNYMNIARHASEKEAQEHTAYDLMLKLGLAKPSKGSTGNALDSAVAKLKTVWKAVMQLSQYNGALMTALRRVKGSDPAFEELRKLVKEIRLSLDSLEADIETRQQAAADWDANHPSDQEGGPK